jgi:hypothetical protein
MTWFRRSSHFTILTVALTLGLVVNVPVKAIAQLIPDSLSSRLENAFRPPGGIGAPVNTIAGGTRGSCLMDDKPLRALLPASGVGTTVAQYPTVFWYMPNISIDPTITEGAAVEFVLKDAKQQVIYSATYPLVSALGNFKGSASIMSLNVATLYPLEIGQEYQWKLTLKCNSKDVVDQSENSYAEGRIKRVPADPMLTSRLKWATPEERVALYADQKLWYETVATLVELRRLSPNDLNLAEAWNTLLNSVGLDIISQEPLFRGARADNGSIYNN